MNKDLKIFLLICWMAFCAYKLVDEIIKDYKASKLSLKSSYPKLVQEVIYYCSEIFKQHKIKYYPLHEISYYESKRKLGSYFVKQKKIVIYIKSHEGSESEKIRQIVHSTLHEVRHHIQLVTNPDFKNYDNYSKKLSYQKNPFEIDSNNFADKHLDDCITHLKQKNILA